MFFLVFFSDTNYFNTTIFQCSVKIIEVIKNQIKLESSRTNTIGWKRECREVIRVKYLADYINIQSPKGKSKLKNTLTSIVGSKPSPTSGQSKNKKKKKQKQLTKKNQTEILITRLRRTWITTNILNKTKRKKDTPLVRWHKTVFPSIYYSFVKINVKKDKMDMVLNFINIGLCLGLE